MPLKLALAVRGTVAGRGLGALEGGGGPPPSNASLRPLHRTPKCTQCSVGMSVRDPVRDTRPQRTPFQLGTKEGTVAIRDVGENGRAPAQGHLL